MANIVIPKPDFYRAFMAARDYLRLEMEVFQNTFVERYFWEKVMVALTDLECAKVGDENFVIVKD